MRIAFGILGGLMVAIVVFLHTIVAAGDFEATYHSSTLWARTYDVAVSGNYAYYVTVYGLEIYDIGDPANRVLISRLRTENEVWTLCVEGEYAYLVTPSDGLYVVNVSDPSSPYVAGQCDIPQIQQRAERYTIVVRGAYAYVCHGEFSHAGENSLYIIDVANPTAPFIAGRAKIPGRPRSVFLSGDLAYIACTDFGLYIVNIADPADPVEVGRFEGLGSLNGTDYMDVVVSGGYAFVADYAYNSTLDSGGFQILDVSDPSDPKLVTLYDIHLLYDVVLSGTTAYISTQNNGLYAFDISDPATPVLLDHNEEYAYAAHMALGGENLIVTTGIKGIYDASDPAAIRMVSSDGLTGDSWDVDIAGDYAYVAQTASGLTVLDISDPDAARIVGNYPVEGSVIKVRVAGDYAYAAAINSSENGVYAFDIGNPAAPKVVGKYVCSGLEQINEFYIEGDRMYATAYKKGLHILDISNPSTPTLLGIYRPEGDTLVEMAVAVGDYAYVSTRRNGLEIIDVSDPAAPVRVGSYLDPGGIGVVNVAGEKLLFSNGSGTHILDISDPVHPVVTGTFEGYPRHEATVYNDLVFLPLTGSFLVIDISNPSQPLRLDSIVTPGYVWRVAATTDRLYIADQYAFLIMDATFPSFKRGDVNGDNGIDIGDAVSIMNYIFKDGIAPEPVDAGDANCDGMVDVGDAVNLINYLFKGGVAPVCQ